TNLVQPLPQQQATNTIQLTRELETKTSEAQPAPQPIIIQAPPQKEDKKIIRRSENSDMMLGLMNANMMEG
ncbi:MAG: hypothetical protein KAJ19_24285, partial [Gammaproteobacteria bacterium]|nr:hypothetical protein [Gammaproteobacteria bacterium]